MIQRRLSAALRRLSAALRRLSAALRLIWYKRETGIDRGWRSVKSWLAEDARQGTEEARQGTEEARQGTEEARQGTEEARQGTEEARRQDLSQSLHERQEPVPARRGGAFDNCGTSPTPIGWDAARRAQWPV